MLTIQLSKPVTHNEKTYSELTFREAQVGDFMVADSFSGQMSKTIATLAVMCDVPLPAFKKIGAADFNAILDKTKELLGNEEQTSTTGE